MYSLTNNTQETASMNNFNTSSEAEIVKAIFANAGPKSKIALNVEDAKAIVKRGDIGYTLEDWAIKTLNAYQDVDTLNGRKLNRSVPTKNSIDGAIVYVFCKAS